MPAAAVLTTEPLSRSDKLDLLEMLDALPPDTVEERAADLPPGELGEPVMTVLLITLTMDALAGIAAWLAARGKDVEFSMAVEVPGVKGSFTVKAHGGDSAHQIADQCHAKGVQVSTGEPPPSNDVMSSS